MCTYLINDDGLEAAALVTGEGFIRLKGSRPRVTKLDPAEWLCLATQSERHISARPRCTGECIAVVAPQQTLEFRQTLEALPDHQAAVLLLVKVGVPSSD
jgi:DNA-directed RNA polymerase specialized sigma24 family protein